MLSPGYDPEKNCQFPRDIRVEGRVGINGLKDNKRLIGAKAATDLWNTATTTDDESIDKLKQLKEGPLSG